MSNERSEGMPGEPSIHADGKRYLVVGATGHVGSQVAVLLADRGHDVSALVRKPGARILDPHEGPIRYVVGDLADERSMAEAVRGIDVVVCTASGNIPQKRGDYAASVNDGVVRLIGLCEAAGVRRFVLSSVPTYPHDDRVPELAGKRRVEARLAASTMQTIVVRNPAFMDVFLVMGGFKQVASRSAHATTGRDYWFTKLWMALVGNLVQDWGLFIAPGGGKHGSPMIATRDVAEMLVGGALYMGDDDLLIESGGPEWLTWRQIGDLIARRAGRKRVRLIPVPAWAGRMQQLIVRPFSAPAANVMALIGFVAAFQPRWDSAAAVRKLGLPKQTSLSEFLDQNYQAS